MSVFSRLRGLFNRSPRIDASGLSNYVSASYYDGTKFPGGFGATELFQMDYWTLRARSVQLFTENLYAKGLITRLVTNEINTGLTPEASPNERILGLPEDSLAEWSETVEMRHELWSDSPLVCDWDRTSTFGEIQRRARREALIEGDVLVVLRQSARTGRAAVQLFKGSCVRTPLSDNTTVRKGNKIREGVEFDVLGREVAYWVCQDDGRSKRLPAYGEKSGRRIAWLVFGVERRVGEARGMPILAAALQSLKEIDRYRDSTQRKAVINSILAMFVKKSSDKPGTLPLGGGAVRKGTVDATASDGTGRSFNAAKFIPGMVIDELQEGEEPVLKGGEGTDVNFGPFEESIIQLFAWANEVPPEILRLSFSNNYSASQAAINEFKIYLNRVWSAFGAQFCQPIYEDGLISDALTGRIEAPGLLESWRDPRQFDTFAAWTQTDWYGSIKPSTDMLKQARGSRLLVEEAWSTNAREARITTGTKFSKNVQRLRRENIQKAEALRPMLELEAEFGSDEVDRVNQAISGISQDNKIASFDNRPTSA